jgi:hypothetical protein
MSLTSLESALYTVLAAAIAAAVADEDNALHGVALHQSPYEAYPENYGIRIGDSNCDLAPGPDGPVEEWDVIGRLECFAKVVNADSASELVAARAKVRAMGIAVAEVLIADPTLGGGVHDSRILGGERGWPNVQTERRAGMHLHIIANETGAVSA